MAYEEEPDPEDDEVEDNEMSEQADDVIAEEEHSKPSPKDDIIADEEREIQKIIDEGEKAAKEAEEKDEPAPEDSKPAEISDDNKPEDNSGLWKWFIAGIAIVVIIGVTFMFFRHTNTPDLTTLQNTGPLAKFDPSEFLDGWKLENKYLTFADLPMEKKKEFFDMQNLSDIATWEFSKGGESLFVWIRQFSDEESAKLGAKTFAPIAWHIDEQSMLAFGDEGRIGIYKITGQDPLTSFVRQDISVLSIAYYNQGNQLYDPATMVEDKAFLTALTKKLMTKIVSADGSELKVADIKV